MLPEKSQGRVLQATVVAVGSGSKGKGGEIQLTDAIKTLLNTQKVYAYDFEGIRYDVGDKFGFVKATIDFALDRDELKDQVMTYIKTLVK